VVNVADAVNPAFSALTGLTEKSPLEIDTVTFGITFVPTAAVGSITVTLSGAVANGVFLSVWQIPISAF
jgi:hypothetical protein